jgi:hypothetical protein
MKCRIFLWNADIFLCLIWWQFGVQLKHSRRGISYLQHRLLSAMHVHGAVSGRLATPLLSGIVAESGTVGAFGATAKEKFVRRQGSVKDASPGVLRPGLVKAKQQGWQDLQAEPEPAQTLPVDRDAGERISQFEWKEFEEAVEYKDLGRALKVLEALSNFESDATAEDGDDVVELSLEGNGDGNGSLRVESSNGTGTSYESFALPRTDYMKILDTCQSAQDLQLVGQAYGWLQNEGFLQSFGKYKARGNTRACLAIKVFGSATVFV